MTSIYLIRPAEAEGNLYRIAQGQDNSNLTDRGWRQVQALEKRFADVHIDAVYASDLYRTCATASAIYKPKGLPLHRVRGLREICVGCWEQRTWGDIYRKDPLQMDYFNHQPAKWCVEGAETPWQVQERVLEALRTLAVEHEGKTIAVFSHGYAIRLVLAHLQGYTMEEVGQTPTGDNTAVSLLEVNGDQMKVVFRDDNSHLKTPEYLAGEKVRKRAVALEPGLWFEPLRLPEQADFLKELVAANWNRREAFDEARLLADAIVRQTLVGYLRGEPIGVVQLGPESGWISLLCIREDCRKRGFGAQLIGQAVQHTRPRGGEKLSVAFEEDPAAQAFFGDYGFSCVGRTESGKMLLEKDIRFLPEFLSE